MAQNESSPNVAADGPAGRLRRWTKSLSWWDASAAAACGLALAQALHTTEGLRRPYDLDHFRDISAAQTAVDGAPLADPFYRGEMIWYNPLVPWLVGIGSAATGVPVPEFHARSGPWLNLVAPAGMYVLGSTLFGRPAAFASTTSFLFLTCGEEPSWACATYSPWLFTSDFAQGIFYLALVSLLAAHSRRTFRTHAGAGVMAGLTFLGHTAPAIFLATIAAVLLATDTDRRSALKHGAVMAVTAGMIALPFLASIVGRYHLHVLNRGPMEWPWEPLSSSGISGLVGSNALQIAAALIGLVAVLWRGPKTVRLVVATWGALAIGLIAYRLTRDEYGLLQLPAVLPALHFWFYFKALVALLIGVAGWALARLLARPWLRAVLVVATFSALVWLRFPGYLAWDDLRFTRYVALGRSAAYEQASQMIRRTTNPQDVFLATDRAGLLIVGPAGRKTVAVRSEFSNPYVDCRNRARHRDLMFTALKGAHLKRFKALAARYGVSHVIGVGEGECQALLRGGWQDGRGVLHPAFRLQDVCLFDVK
jgi:hypothetical protein